MFNVHRRYGVCMHRAASMLDFISVVIEARRVIHKMLRRLGAV